jgi:predicted nuclease of predicted toxin-antitoxin system
MNILVDMNLSPDWCRWLEAHGIGATHWSKIGNANAADTEVLNWAASHGYIILTHDLDFGAILAASGAATPSVVLLRMDDVIPDAAGPWVADVLQGHAQLLATGALLCIEPARSRIRVLPLR